MANLLFSLSSNCGEGFFQKTLRFQYINCSDINVASAYGGPGLSSKWYSSSLDSIWSQAILITNQQLLIVLMLVKLRFDSGFWVLLNFLCLISPRDFFSFARQFLQRGAYRLIVFHWSQRYQDKFRLAISAITSNCFHPLGNKTLFLKQDNIHCK